MLLLLLAIPVGVALYLVRERRRRLRLDAYRGAGTTRGVEPDPADRPARLRRRIPAVLMLIGLVFLVVAMARPEGVVRIPRIESTVILAFDVSGSMGATDLSPNRMEAAKTAARAFVERQPTSVRIGVVAFSDSAFSIQAPTDDQVLVLAAIDRLAPERGTSLGQGILTSLATIAAAEDDQATNYYTNRSPDPSATPTPVPVGSYTSAVIVLLSDGENTVNPDPIEAAGAAADRGVRIFTVGIGSTAGTTIEVEGFKIHSRLDEAMLGEIADVSGGAYHAAADPAELTAIYEGIDTRIIVRPETMEITALVAGLGLVILVIGAAASLLWLGRVP
jgi:Ca-activated chloride channel family protein